MFKRSYRASKERSGKPGKVSKRSFRDDCKQRLRDELYMRMDASPETSPSLGERSPRLNSAIFTITVGKDQRVFAAHEDVLSRSPYFREECRAHFFSSPAQSIISLPDDEPEVISAVLEYLYKGDYQPRLLHDKRRNAWLVEDTGIVDLTASPRSDAGPLKKTFVGPAGGHVATIYHHGVGDYILRDTAVYCAALRFGLPELQRLALRKQGLQQGVSAATVLRSARFAYANTPESDSQLRAHYLALIIRRRDTFRQSGTLQMEMLAGGTQMFFDLFVALCHHIDDVSAPKGSGQNARFVDK